MHEKLMRKSVNWWIFVVLAALLPLLADLVQLFDSNREHGLLSLLSDGELLMISAVLAIAALGEVITAAVGRVLTVRAAAVLVLVVVLLVIQSLWYVDIASKVHTAFEPPPPTDVAFGSIVCWCITAVTGASCVYLAVELEG